MKHLEKFSTFESSRSSDKLTKLDDITGIFNDDLDVQVESEDDDDWPIDFKDIKNFKLTEPFGDEIFTIRITGSRHFDGFKLNFTQNNGDVTSFDAYFEQGPISNPRKWCYVTDYRKNLKIN